MNWRICLPRSMMPKHYFSIFSCLENLMNRGDWRATVHGLAKSWTRLKWLSTHPLTHTVGGSGNEKVVILRKFLQKSQWLFTLPVWQTLFNWTVVLYIWIKKQKGHLCALNIHKWTSPVVQWLRLCLPMQGSTVLIPGQGTKIPYAAQWGQKLKIKNVFFN